MKKNLIKTFILSSICIIPFNITLAQTPVEEDVKGGSASLNYTILPEIDSAEADKLNEIIQDIGNTGGTVMDRYREHAEKMTVEESLATGVMTRDTLIDYLVYIVKFLSQLGLAVGAGFIIYAGYTYMLSVFNGGKAKPEVIKNAIIGVIIVIFSYAIMKTLTAIFLGS